MPHLRLIDSETVAKLAPPPTLVGWMREAMTATSRRDVCLPLRRGLQLPEDRGMLGIMPGFVGGIGSAGVKLTSLVPAEHRRGSSHLGLMILYDAAGLVPLAIMSGSTITALRTAAVTALATHILARGDANILAIFGAGEQADAHVRALAHTRQWRECRIWNRSPDAAKALAERLQEDYPFTIMPCQTRFEAVYGADVICTTTSSSEPVLPETLVEPGCHVNLVGASSANAREVSKSFLGIGRVFIDFWPSFRDQAGEFLDGEREGLITESHISGELGEVILGLNKGRTSTDEITIYKSLGIAAQDILFARMVYDQAVALGLGAEISI